MSREEIIELINEYISSRVLRNIVHLKQNRMQINEGVPDIHEMMEAVPVLRSVSGVGIVEYVRFNGQLYRKVFDLNQASIGKTWDEI